jgi:hypothetical protein
MPTRDILAVKTKQSARYIVNFGWHISITRQCLQTIRTVAAKIANSWFSLIPKGIK